MTALDKKGAGRELGDVTTPNNISLDYSILISISNDDTTEVMQK